MVRQGGLAGPGRYRPAKGALGQASAERRPISNSITQNGLCPFAATWTALRSAGQTVRDGRVLPGEPSVYGRVLTGETG